MATARPISAKWSGFRRRSGCGRFGFEFRRCSLEVDHIGQQHDSPVESVALITTCRYKSDAPAACLRTSNDRNSYLRRARRALPRRSTAVLSTHAEALAELAGVTNF